MFKYMILKKMSVTVLSLALILGYLNFFSTEKVEAYDEDESDGIAYALGIVEKGADKNMTRGDTVGVAVRMLGCGDTLYDENLIFEDVMSNDKNAGAISVAYKLGLIGGTSETLFEPNEYVTYEQVAKIIVNLLGYREYAEDVGGYPKGYLFTAARLGVNNNVNLNSGDKVSRNNMAKIVENSLNIKLVHRPLENGGSILYGEDDSIANSVFGINEYNGIVTAAYGFKLTPHSSDMRENEVQINDTTYIDATGKIKEMIGYEIKFYTQGEEDEPETIIYAEKESCKEVTIKPEWIKRKIIDNKHIGIEYYIDDVSNRTVSEDLYFNSVKLVYNGVYTDITIDTDKLFEFTDGSIKILDSNEDGVWDFIFIDRYVTAVVDSFVEDTQTVYLEYPVILYDASVKSINLENYEIVEITDDLKYDNFVPGDVIQIYPLRTDALPGNIIKFKRSQTTVTGEISGKNLKNGVNQVVMDGTGYTFAESFATYNPGVYDDMMLGEKYTFYLNNNNQIAYVSNFLDKNRVYGYLTAVAVDEVFEKNVFLKVFVQDGYFYEFELADKVRVYMDGNDKGIMQPYDAVKHLFADGVFDKNKAQLIRFRPDKETKIDILEFADNVISEAANGVYEHENAFVKSRSRHDTMWYRFSKITYKDNAVDFPCPSYIVYFTVPENIEDLNNEKAFSVGTCPYRSDREYITVDTFSDDSIGAPKIIVNYSSSAKNSYVNQGSGYVLVKDVIQTIDEDGEDIIQVISSNGTVYNSLTEDNVFYDKNDSELFGVGDILQIGSESYGTVKAAVPIFTMDYSAPNGIGYAYSDPDNQIRYNSDGIVASGVYHNERQIASGYISDIKSGYIELTNSAGDEQVFFMNTTKVSTFYPKRQIFEEDTVDELNIGDFVILRLYLSMGEQIIRYIK